MILALRTDSSKAELYLLDSGGEEVDRDIWAAGHQLSVDILTRINALLEANQQSFADLEGVAIFQGPGSFTGLRIGFTVGNTIAYSLGVPAVTARGDDWLRRCAQDLKSARPGEYPQPHYGKGPNITRPKK